RGAWPERRRLGQGSAGGRRRSRAGDGAGQALLSGPTWAFDDLLGETTVPDPFIGEIRMFAFGFAPQGWALCNGQLLPIAQNQALFSLLGTTYGGNGTTTFALPNLQSRLPVHQGQGQGLSNYSLGQTAGTASVTIDQTTLPTHTHIFSATTTNATSA